MEGRVEYRGLNIGVNMEGGCRWMHTSPEVCARRQTVNRREECILVFVNFAGNQFW